MAIIDYSNLCEEEEEIDDSNQIRNNGKGLTYKWNVFLKLVFLIIIVGIVIKLMVQIDIDGTIKFHDENVKIIYILGFFIFWIVIIFFMITFPLQKNEEYHHFYLLFLIFFIYYIFFITIIGNNKLQNNIFVKLFKNFYSKNISYPFILFMLWSILSISDRADKNDFLLKYTSESDNKSKQQKIIIFFDTGLNILYFLIIAFVSMYYYSLNEDELIVVKPKIK